MIFFSFSFASYPSPNQIVIKKSKLIKLIDREINKLRRKNLTAEEELEFLNKRFDRLQKKQTKKLRQVLRSERKFEKMFAKLEKKLSRSKFKEQLELSLSASTIRQNKESFQNEILSFGGLENFLVMAKDELQSSSSAATMPVWLDTLLTYLAIAAIGVAVICVALFIVSIFAPGVLPIAIWGAVGAGVVLLPIFVFANLEQETPESLRRQEGENKRSSLLF